MDLIEDIKRHLPKVNSEINYWLVRTNSGDYYDEFVYENYIGVGWNKVTLDELKRKQPIGEIVKDHYDEENRPGYVGKQILKFVKEIKKGDIVLIPSKNSKYIQCGYVADDNVYEADIPIESEDPNNTDAFELEEESCPYRKRRNVNWIKPLKRADLDPKLYLLLYSHHTISKANEYRDLINRAIFDMYILDEKCYATFYIGREDNIAARGLVEFISDLLNINNVNNQNEKDNLEIKISVQSEGITEIIDNAQNIIWTCIVIYSIIGGRFKISHLIEVETKGIAGVVKEFIQLKKSQGIEIDESTEKRVMENAENLKINQPEELKKAIEEVQSEKSAQKS